MPSRTKTFRDYRTIAADIVKLDVGLQLNASSGDLNPHTMAGYIICFANPSRKRRRRSGCNGYVENFWLATFRNYRRMGIAKSLILQARDVALRDFGIDIAREHRLHVMTVNESAIRLYQRMGFRVHAVKKNYPNKPYQALRMIWSDTV